MRILHIISLGHPAGGAEQAVLMLRRSMTGRGHTVEVLSSDIDRDAPGFFADHTFRRLPERGPGRYLYRAFSPHSYQALKRLLRTSRPDLVHLHTMGQASPSVLFLLRRVPTVLTVHGPEEFTRWLLPWYLPASDYRGEAYVLANLTPVGRMRLAYHRYLNGPVYRLGLRHVDRTVAVSEYIHRQLAREGMNSLVVPNAVELQPPDAQQPVLEHRLLCVGRLEQYKGVEFAVRALRTVRERFPDTVLQVVGEGPDRARLTALAVDLGVGDSVEFTGALPYTEVVARYRWAGLLLLPTIAPEAFGKVGIEAMSTGTPVIGADVGGVSDWLRDGVNGWLVEPGRADRISDRVVELFSDPQVWRRMSEQARCGAEQFSLERHTDLMEAVYRDVVAGRTAGTGPGGTEISGTGISGTEISGTEISGTGTDRV